MTEIGSNIVAALLVFLGGAGGVKLLDLARERWRAGDVREEREDVELAAVRAEYRADKRQLQDEIQVLRQRVEDLTERLTATQLKLGEALAITREKEALSLQLGRAYSTAEETIKQQSVQIATLTNELLAYRAKYGPLHTGTDDPPVLAQVDNK